MAVLCTLPVLGFLTVKITPWVSPVFVVALLAVPLGVLAIARSLELGIVVMMLMGVFVRLRIPTGTASEIPLSLAICGGCIVIWIVRMLVEQRRLWIRPATVNVPLLGFIATVAFSWLWSRAFRDLLVYEISHPLISVAAGLVMILLPACLLLVMNNVRSMRWVEVLVWILLFEGLMVLIVDLGMAWASGMMAPVYNFLSNSPILQLNSQGLLSMWCVSFALALALFGGWRANRRRLHWVWRGLLLLYVGGWMYWGFVLRTSWLSGWVPAFAAAAVVAFMRSRKLFVVVVVVLLVVAGVYYWRTSFTAETQESGISRLAAYTVNWRVTSKHLLFGTGPAGYASYYMNYYPKEATASHSTYVDTLAQTGIVGAVFFVWFFGAQLWKGYRASRQLKGRGDMAESLAVAVLGGTAGCVVAMALGDWLLPFAYTQGIAGFDLAVYNWLFMGCLWAVCHIVVPRSSPGSVHAASDGGTA